LPRLGLAAGQPTCHGPSEDERFQRALGPASRTGCWQPTDDRRILAVRTLPTSIAAPPRQMGRAAQPPGVSRCRWGRQRPLIRAPPSRQIAWAAAGVNNVKKNSPFTSQSTALNGAGRPLRHFSGRPRRTHRQKEAPSPTTNSATDNVAAHAAHLRMKRGRCGCRHDAGYVRGIARKLRVEP
jgi:hypothetical protein